MTYELLFPNWFGLIMTTPTGLKSALKNPLICGVEDDFAVSEMSNAMFPSRKPDPANDVLGANSDARSPAILIGMLRPRHRQSYGRVYG